MPGAADVVPTLEHREVLDPLLLEADRHAEAGEAAADDRDVDVEGVHLSSGDRVAQGLEARVARLPVELALGLARVHDRRPRRHLDPLDRGREEGQLRQAHERARGDAREPRRDRQRGEAELARDVGAGQHAVAGDVVGPGRAGGDDALQEGLADVVLVDELHAAATGRARAAARASCGRARRGGRPAARGARAGGSWRRPRAARGRSAGAAGTGRAPDGPADSASSRRSISAFSWA